MAEKLVKVWEVLADGPGEGPAGDGTHVYRFRSEREATEFAKGKTLYGRDTVTADMVEVSRKLAQRWGMA